MPAGVNSPVRSFRAVGGEPIFFARGDGAYLYDHHGKRYIDYVNAWGAAIVGHAHPQVIAAVGQTLQSGLGFGAPHEREVEFAECIHQLMPDIEQLRAVSSGTEATMSAIRVARGYTEKNLLIKFAGCYHGHSDALLVDAGSGALTFGDQSASSAGVTAGAINDTLVLPYNDEQALADAFDQYGRDIAAVILEPIAGNMNLIIPNRSFLTSLRDHCDQHNALLIFDEVMSGFRVGAGGAQRYFDVKPDMTCLGKVIGGGLNVGVFGGAGEIMSVLSPVGNVYQAGTLSGNPIALSAGLANLQIIRQDGFFDAIGAKAQALATGLTGAAAAAGVDFCAQSVGAMLGFYFHKTIPHNFAEVRQADTTRFAKFFHLMLAEGIYLAPSAFEAGFISAAHSDEDIAETIGAGERAFQQLANEAR